MRRPRTARFTAVVCRGCALLLVTITTATAQGESLETIQLAHRTADELLPILQPLVPPGAVLTGTDNVLVVRADDATLQQLRAAIASLDHAPRQLLITVGQSTGTRGNGTSVRGSGTIGSGDVQVGVNEPPQRAPGGQVVVRSGSTSADLSNVSSVRALEGYETYIAIGQSRPYTTTTTSGSGYYGSVVTQTTGYRDVQTGFYATPRVNGDRVTLQISPHQQRATGSGRDEAVSTAGVTTTVSGRLGEWIEMGGASESSSGTQTGLVTWGSRSGSTQYSAWVKVEEVP